ncbi:predicted protein [Nematostella vectensis]|uniref:Phosphatidylinositol transfer protein N-terminal domain-containing protein n=1 Tax=Nematostella vectensis TaxID=45351 RepID=A7RZ10_NEMVE|nr:phosphatidylinositol transfer protein alpha isoform [Nematostella vectensis]EDO43322.1 predicted protein [Nematostella vectensis]|eukprot:XP_001635385.1 predicted protein [Nematostella vectensis]
MGTLKEYRVELPISVENYRIAQLYTVTEASMNETGGGEGIEVVKNEPYVEGKGEFGNDVTEPGQYTLKIMHLKSKVPQWIVKLAPEGALEVHEEAWNAYPYCKTVYTNPYMGENFHVIIKTWHKEGPSSRHSNVHELNESELAKREVIDIDIAAEKKLVGPHDYKEDEDPLLVRSEKANCGPLTPDWNKGASDTTKDGYPMMTCYKLYDVRFKWCLLQTVVESEIGKAVYRLLRNFHRQMFCWMDRWYGLTLDDIRRIEDETKDKLDKMRNEGEVKGMKCG